MSTRKKNIKGAFVNREKVIIAVLASMAALLAVILLSLFLTGFRYKKISYLSVLSSEKQEISFLGFVDKEGVPKSGKLFYPSKNASVSVNDTGLHVLSYSDGGVYTGEMEGLQRQGKGIMVYSSGDRYEGEFSGDKFQGYGVYTYASGDRYEGDFRAGKKSGEGKYFWYDGEEPIAEYTGAFLNDKRNGYGIFKSVDGTVYAGNFSNDLREDRCAEVSIPNPAGGTDRYFGAYEKDVREGFGYYFYASGNVYVGNFEKNKPEGKGTIYFVEGGSYTGTFVNGNLTKDKTPVSEEDAQAFFNSIDLTVNPLTDTKSKLG